MPAETDRLKKEREELHAALERNAKDLNRAVNGEINARQAVDDQKVKIAQARDALATYVRLTKEKAIAA